MTFSLSETHASLLVVGKQMVVGPSPPSLASLRSPSSTSLYSSPSPPPLPPSPPFSSPQPPPPPPPFFGIGKGKDSLSETHSPLLAIGQEMVVDPSFRDLPLDLDSGLQGQIRMWFPCLHG